MKKVEAMLIAPEKSNLIMEYIDQFLLYDKGKSKIYLSYYQDKSSNKEAMCSFEIYSPDGGEYHYDSGITLQQSGVLTSQVLMDLADKYVESDSIYISHFIDKKVFMPTSRDRNFHGIQLKNSLNESEVLVDFLIRGNDFEQSKETYEEKLSSYIEKTKTRNL